MTTTSRNFFLGITLVASGLLAPYSSFAQGTEGIQVKPAIVDDKVTPGQEYHFRVIVSNLSGSDKTYKVSAQDISKLDDAGLPVFASPGEVTGYSLSSWISLPSDPISIKAGSSAEVNFTVHVPNSVSPGAHFGGVFFDSGAQTTSGNGSAVAMRVGTIINLQIAGDILEDARMREFSTEKLVYGIPDVTFASKIENLGNVLVRPRGVITITDVFGKEVATLTVNDQAAPIFPNSSRAYITNWKNDSFAIGRYQAILSVNYGADTKRTITATTSFWVLPLPLIGGVVGGLLFLALALYIGLKVYIRKQLRAMGVQRGRESDAVFYQRKYQRSGLRLVVLVFSLALLCVILLVSLFLFFA